MPKYPAQIDDNTSLPLVVDNLTPVQGAVFNKLRDSVLAIEKELGIKPSGLYSSVAARLNTLETIVGNLRPIEVQEDIGGTPESPLIVGIQGRPISTVAPALGQSLIWDGIAWVPQFASGVGGGVVAGGDLLGLYPNPTVFRSSSFNFTILGNEIIFSGGEDGYSRFLAETDTLRDGIVTVDATPGVLLNSITPNDGQLVRVLSEIAAVTTGDAAWFLLKGVWLRVGGSLVVVKAPSVVDSGSTAGASSWSAALVASGTSIQTQVTGATETNIHWSIIREFVEAS